MKQAKGKPRFSSPRRFSRSEEEGRKRVEETFRFLKQLFGLEGFTALNYASIMAIGFHATVAMCFLAWVIERRTALFFDAMDAHQDTRESFGENGILEKYGSEFLRVYRVARNLEDRSTHLKASAPGAEETAKEGRVRTA